MNQEQTDYTAANLSESLVGDLQNFENKLRNESNKELVIIAYEKESNH